MQILTYPQLAKIGRIPLRLLSPERVVKVKSGPLRGVKWIVGAANHSYWLGIYEREKLAAFARSINERSVVYDVGAHVGLYSLAAARSGAQVIAFEPFPRNVHYLRRHIDLNNAKVDLHEVAVSDAAGTSFFQAHSDSTMGMLSATGKIEVKTVVLDELLSQGLIPPPTIIKMDIEGAEYLALMGARSILTKHHPAIFLATHGAEVHERCMSLLQSFDYQMQPVSTPDEILAT